jgi:hypothetical protein
MIIWIAIGIAAVLSWVAPQRHQPPMQGIFVPPVEQPAMALEAVTK